MYNHHQKYLYAAVPTSGDFLKITDELTFSEYLLGTQ